jgi:hypothetical protein
MTKHGKGCDCDTCDAYRTAAKLIKQGWTKCDQRCGRLLPPGSSREVCDACEPCETCGGTGNYEVYDEGADVECFCQECDTGLDSMFETGEPWYPTLYPTWHTDYLKRQAAMEKEAA